MSAKAFMNFTKLKWGTKKSEKIRKIVGKFPPPDPLPPTEVEARRGNMYKSMKEFGKLNRAKMLSDKK